ncbi:MAG: glycosyltransferase family 2 protein [Planctomycetota bacterium]|nr:glycosyltransferase family 2 protein [Planctomycetota bacterium]
MNRAMEVSAIVPTLDEEAHVTPCLERLRAAGIGEILVVDGGSADRTRDRASRVADRVLEVGGGLFVQLNAGGEAARGDVLVFHYADGHFPQEGVAAILRALEDPRVLGGAFCLGFASSELRYRLIAWGAGFRNRLGFGPFGDQTIFLRARVFREIGGFDADVFLADFELVREVRRRGTFRLLSLRLPTSVRRWEQRGVFRTLLWHWKLSAAYLLRVGRGNRARKNEAERLRRVR